MFGNGQSRIGKCEAGFALAGCFVMLSTSNALAQDINMEQLRRVLRGETIPEAIPQLESVENTPAAEPELSFTEEFFDGACRFRPTGGNQFCTLTPGMRSYLNGMEDGDFIEVFITVLPQTQVIACEIDGRMRRVKTRVVEEYELTNGELSEISLNYLARCTQTNDIYYFGEDVRDFENNVVVSTEGTWRAGENGARAGIIMPGTFLLGARYMHEHAEGVALDRAEHIAMGQTVEVPAGIMHNCVVIHEDSEFDFDDFTEKTYAPGVGVIRDGSLELVCFGRAEDCPIPEPLPSDEDPDEDDEEP